MTPMSQPMNEPPHETHGNTPAAWTAVTIIMIAFLVGTIGLIVNSWPMFWVAIGLVAVGAIVGRVMAMAGLGKKPVAQR